MKSLYLLIQNKILLAILAGVVSIGSFQIWQYNQEKHYKFLAQQEQSCKFDLSRGEDNVRQSRNLRNLKYNQVVNPGLEQPGINSEFKPGKGYVLIYTNNRPLLATNSATYETDFLKSLSTADGFAPQPLVVTAVSIDVSQKQALVSSACSPKPFIVPLENLYETFQPIDISN